MSLLIPQQPAIAADDDESRSSRGSTTTVHHQHNRKVKRRLDFGQDDVMESFGKNLPHPADDTQGKLVLQSIFRDNMLKNEQKIAEFRRIWDFCPVDGRPLHSNSSEWAWEKIRDSD